MSENKFKVGDKVKVVRPIYPTYYKEGYVGIVRYVGGEVLDVEFPGDSYGWAVLVEEVELVEEEQHVTPKQIEAELNRSYAETEYRVSSTGEIVEVPVVQAKRYNSGKAPLSYILYWPKAIEALANVCRKGEEKYEKFNYKKGAPVSQYMDSGLRHQTAFVNGEDLDPETQCYHLAMDIWNKFQALEVMLTPEMKERFDDRYKP